MKVKMTEISRKAKERNNYPNLTHASENEKAMAIAQFIEGAKWMQHRLEKNKKTI